MTSSGSRTATAAAERDPATVWLALGTNLGDRAAQLSRAVIALDDVMHVDALSGVYDTEPYGYADQPRFWNMAVRGQTDLSPAALLLELQDIERRLGREPTFRMGPRHIDIDILLYDSRSVDTHGLRIPHPGMMDRAFVLLPLAELDPGLRHPVTGAPLAERARELGAEGLARLGPAASLLTLPHGVAR